MRKRIFGSTPSPYFFFSFQFVQARALVALSLVLVVLVSSGTAYAAEGALPGQPLYAIKINVNEKVEEALAVSSADKAEVHRKLAARRVEEAEALAERGSLDATLSAELAQSFDTHARVAAALAENLAEDNPTAAEEARVQFDSSLKAHGEILARLGEVSSSSDVRNNSGAISRAVVAAAGQTKVRALSAFAASAPEPTFTSQKGRGAGDSSKKQASTTRDNNQKVAAGLEARASLELAAVKKQYEAQKGTLSAEVVVRIETRLAASDSLMSEGSAALGAGEYGDAQQDFAAALRASIELSTYLRAQTKFEDKGLLNKLLERSEQNNKEESNTSLHIGL